MNKEKIYSIGALILGLFVLLTPLALVFYGLGVNAGLIPSNELEFYEVNGFILMSLGVGMFNLFLNLARTPKKKKEAEDEK